MNPFNAFSGILKMYINEKVIKELPHKWSEKSRVYHNTNHLIQIILDIEKSIWFKELNVYEKQALLLASFFHDAIYDPKKKDNEEQSIKYFAASFKEKEKDPKMLNIVCGLIETTKHRKRPINKLQKIFWDADNAKFKKGYNELLKYEKEIQKENSFLTKTEYKEKRIKFLEEKNFAKKLLSY